MRRMIVLTLVLAPAGLVHAGQAADSKYVLDLWDAAYLQGARAGHVHTYTEEVGGVLRTTVELRLTLKKFNDTIQIGMDTGTFETPEGKVTGVFMRQYLGKSKRLEITGTVAGRELRLTQDGARPLAPAPWDDRVVGLRRQQSLLAERGIKAGDQFDYLSFEPTVNLVLNTHVAAKEVEEVELFGGTRQARLLRVESRPQRVENVQLPTLVTWVDAEKKQVRGEVEIPGLGQIVLYRTTRAEALAPVTSTAKVDIGLGQLIRLKQRILRPYETSAAVYRIRVRDDEDPASTFAQDDRQQIRNVQGHSFELHVRADSGAGRAVAEPGVEYLQSSYFINSDDVRVKELGRQAAGAAADAWQRALRIERWVHANMKTVNHEAFAPADQVARTLEGDCTEYAMLTAAMCRSVGVPSRTAVGLIYADVKGSPVFAFHMWTEVWVRGQWLPLDATLGRGYVGATHLKIASQSWHEARTMTPLFPVVRVLGRISIEILGVEEKRAP